MFAPRLSAAPRRRRGLIAVLASLAVLSAALFTPSAAIAAVPGGPATVSTTLDIVSGTDLVTPLTQLKANEAAPLVDRRYGLQVGYSCGPAASCDATTITIAPQQLDAFYGTQRFATYDSGTLPPGASITTSAQGGQTVTLGTLAPGTTGSFTLLYSYQTRLNSTPAAQSFFLDGTTITNTATIDAANAGATSAASDSVTWRIETKAPLVAISSNTVARANTDYTYTVRMATDCMWYTTANYGEPAKLCAASYQNTLTLPTGVTFVSASPDGTYNTSTNTVSWAQSGQAAAQGWGSINNNGTPRTVTVRFPDSMFTGQCSIDVSASIATTVTYLDGQVKQNAATASHRASNCTAFGAAVPTLKTASSSQAPNLVWDSGVESYFNIRVGNKANIPGVAVITDNGLDIANMRVYRITAAGASIAYTLDDGTSGTATGLYNAPSNRRIVSMQVTTPEIAGPNESQASTPNTTYYNVNVRYSTVGNAPADGWERSNTASAVMTYPGYDVPEVDEGPSTVNVVIAPQPAQFVVPITRTIPGGANPTAGQPVNFQLSPRTEAVRDGLTLEPQYLFVAPYQWNVVANSWSLAPGAPAGAIFETKTVTINGQSRQAVYVHWPAGTTWGANATWPALSVQATPSAAAPAGSQGVGTGIIGDASNSFPGLAANWRDSRLTDTTDIDGDGNSTEYFALANAAAVTVGASSGLATVKEICQVNPDAADGCDWVSDAAQAVMVSPVATDIKYRVTLRNNGNTSLSNVIAYDVLPYPGDTGISSGSATIPRGSDFSESVSTVSNVSGNLALTYSGSTDPCRTEVFAGGPGGCDNDWSPTAANAASIRAAVTGSLAPGASASFVYTANVLGQPSAGEQACNSIAAAATGVPVSEPSPVCAQIEATDLRVTAGEPTGLQLGRPGVLPFTVTNVAGTDAPATVTVSVPAGVQIRELTFGDWVCSAEGETAPVDGPATLDCVLADPLAQGDSAALDLPVVVTTSGVAVTATVDSDLFDPVPENNTDAITIAAEPAAASGISVTKDDGVAALVPGQETTYDISVTSELIAESFENVEIVDTLPTGVTFVSATAGGVYDEPAGTVTWSVASLSAAGTADVSVTVRIADAEARTSLANTVTAIAADPAFPDVELSDTATDVDVIDRILLTKSATMVAPGDATDPQPGDVLEYEFLVQNLGGGTLSEVVITDPKAGLSEITFPDGWPTTEGTLGSGESATGVARYTLTADDIDNGGTENTATAVGTSAGGAQVASESSVDFPLPAIGGIELTKSAELDVSDVVRAGDEIEYTFDVQNTGNVTLAGVNVTDPLDGLSEITYDWPAAVGVLAAGASVGATATYEVTQADIDRGYVANSATAAGTGLSDEEFTSADEIVTAIPAAPEAAFTKTGALVGDDERPVAGDEIEFAFEISNSGNVTVNGLSVQENLNGVSEIVFSEWPSAAGTLAPDESVTGTATYVLTQADVDAGEVLNTATLRGMPVRGDAVEEDADATVRLAAVSGLVITKSAELLDANADGLANTGERIRYSFALENTGNVTLADVTVADEKVTGLPVTATLAPGQVVTVYADDYTVTAQEATAGTVFNTATATAATPDGTSTVSAPSTSTVRAALLPGDPLATTGGELQMAVLGSAAGLLAFGAVLFITMKRRRESVTQL